VRKGSKHSVEARAKVSVGNRGKIRSQEFREQRLGNLNPTKRSEVREKMSISQKKRYEDPREHEKQSEVARIVMNALEVKEAIRAAAKKQWSDPTYRVKQVETQLVTQNRPEVKARRIKGILASIAADPKKAYERLRRAGQSGSHDGAVVRGHISARRQLERGLWPGIGPRATAFFDRVASLLPSSIIVQCGRVESAHKNEHWEQSLSGELFCADFWVDVLHIWIEYDEFHHQTDRTQQAKDRRKDAYVQSQHYYFLRVKEGRDKIPDHTSEQVAEWILSRDNTTPLE